MNRIMKILIPVTILLIPAYLIRFAIFGIPTNILEILVLLTFIFYLLKGQCSFWNFYKSNKVVCWSILAIFAGLVISTLAGGDYRTGFGIIKGWFAVPLIFAWILYEEIKTGQDLKNTVKWLYIGIFSVALTSLAYYFSGNLTYDGRLKAFYLSPNHLAMYLAPGLIIGIYLIRGAISQLADKTGEGWRRPAYVSRRHLLFLFYIISLLIILLGLYLTYSYAAWVAVMASLIITSLIKYKKIDKRVFLISLIILLLIIVSQWNTGKFVNLEGFTRSSLESRIMIWKSAGNILEDNPAWGIGPGSFQDKYLEYQKYFPPYLEWAVPQPHNLYLAFWLQSGLLGLTGFLVLIIKWPKELLALIKKQKNSGIIAALLGMMLYILIHGLVDTPYWKNDLALVFWIVFSLGLIFPKLKVNPV